MPNTTAGFELSIDVSGIRVCLFVFLWLLAIDGESQGLNSSAIRYNFYWPIWGKVVESANQDFLFVRLGFSHGSINETNNRITLRPNIYFTTPKIPRARLYYRSRYLGASHLPPSYRPAPCDACGCRSERDSCLQHYSGRFGGCLQPDESVDYCLWIQDTSGWCVAIANKPLRLPVRSDPIALRGDEDIQLAKLLEKSVRFRKINDAIESNLAFQSQMLHRMGITLPAADSALSDPHEPVLEAWRIAHFLYGPLYRKKFRCVIFNLFSLDGGQSLYAVQVVYSPHKFYTLHGLDLLTYDWNFSREASAKLRQAHYAIPVAQQGFVTGLVIFESAEPIDYNALITFEIND